MGLHSSLRKSDKSSASRSVMKRTERLKWLREKGQWSETDKVLGLPKIKAMKLKGGKKIKEKAEEKKDGAAPAAAPAAAQTAAAAAKSKK
jgi:small basic protein (TIGR04137 family)